MRKKITKTPKDEKKLIYSISISEDKKIEDTKLKKKEEVCEFCDGTGTALFWNCPVCCDSVF